jgi:hypothetical protein
MSTLRQFFKSWFSLAVLLAALSACNLPQRGVGTPYAPAPALYTAAAQTVSAALPVSSAIPATPRITLALSPSPIPAITLPATLAPAPTLPAASPVLQRPAYDLAARWDGQGQLLVEERIRFRNPADRAVERLTLHVEAARQPGVFTLDRATWETASASLAITGTLRGATLDLALPGPLGPDAQAEITLTYTLDLPNQAGFLGNTQRQVNLGNWFPRLPVYQPEIGWIVHDASNLGEIHLFSAADFTVRLQLPETLVVAASAPARREDAWLTYELAGGRNFVLSFSSQYEVASTTLVLTSTQPARSVELIHYSFPGQDQNAQVALETMRQAVALYSSLYGAYPYPSLSMVEGDFFDGMESDGLFFLGQEYYALYDGTPANYLVALTAHEVSHEWWYSMVGNDQALEPWLDESLATYSELLFYEHYHPELVDWWWEYRVQRFGPGGWVNSRVYDFTEFRPYINAVYLRGALFLADLRAQMGDEDFMAFLKTYANQKTGKIASASDFWEILRQFVDPAVLEAVRSQYFR